MNPFSSDKWLNKPLKLWMPATYRIGVQGVLEKRWADRLGAMRISIEEPREAASTTVLMGRVRDQAELIGILNSLYGLHLPILSVEILEIE